MKSYRALKVVKFALFAALAAAVASVVVMSLWNVLMPGIFGVRSIGFWQALGLLILSKILFGGFRTHRGGPARWRRGVIERWEQMTPGEREKFKQGMRHGCGHRQRGDVPVGEMQA